MFYKIILKKTTHIPAKLTNKIIKTSPKESSQWASHPKTTNKYTEIQCQMFKSKKKQKNKPNKKITKNSFFNNRHKAHYKIYNLCSERKYNIQAFGGMVA